MYDVDNQDLETNTVSLNREETNIDIYKILKYVVLKFNLPALSVRATNILHNLHNLRTVEDFLSLNYFSLRRLPNCGIKSCKEILNVQSYVKKFLENDSIDEITLFSNEEKNVSNQFTQKIPIKYKLLDLRLVNFSSRLHNVLVDNNICSIETLLSYTESMLLRIPHMGRGAINELINFLDKKNIKLGISFEWDENIPIPDETMESFFSELKEFLEQQDEKSKAIYDLRLANSDILTLQDVGKILNLSRERVRQLEKSLIKRISRIFHSYKEVYDNVFSKYGKMISLNVGGAFDKYSEFKWLLINVFAHDIDKDYVVDYERKLLLKEMNISSVFCKLCWDKEELTLSEIETSLDDVLTDDLNVQERENYSLVKKQILEELLVKQFVYCSEDKYILNTENNKNNQCQQQKKQRYFIASKVQKFSKQENIFKANKRENKQIIFMKFAYKFCQESHRVEDIYEEYIRYLREEGLSWYQDYYMNFTAFYHKIEKDKNFLLSTGKMFRYISFSEEEIQQILKTLDLAQYNDVEISTRIIFQNNINVMQQYDIRNEYELHNFIKKFYDNGNINVSRTPILKFGNVNIKSQILDVLSSISPASTRELAKAYEDKYGVKENNLIANYLYLISDYEKNGKYSCDIKTFNEDEFENLKHVFVNDFYALEDIEQLLYSLYNQDMVDYINKYNMNRLGYNLSSSYMFSNKYNTLTDFANYLANQNILDLSLFSGFFSVGLAYNILQERKQTFDLIEFSQNRFINIKLLNEKGLFKEDIEEFISRVENYADNNFFTISSLYNNSFHFPKIDRFGFDEIFYRSILYSSKKFNFKRINGAFLMRHVSQLMDTQEFIIQIMNHLRKINIYELIDYVYTQYAITIDKYFITSTCTISDELYYSDIMEKVYINYDEYLSDL